MDRYQLTNEHRAIKTPEGKWCRASDAEKLEQDNKRLREGLKHLSEKLCAQWSQAELCDHIDELLEGK